MHWVQWVSRAPVRPGQPVNGCSGQVPMPGKSEQIREKCGAQVDDGYGKVPISTGTRQQGRRGRPCEHVSQALRLQQRQAEVNDALRHSNTNRVLAEREIHLVRQRLTRYPAAVQAITLIAADLPRPVEFIRTSHAEQRC